MNTERTRRMWDDFNRPIWRFVRARVDSDADADDVVQDVFERVHTRQTQLREDERVAGWIFRIASNAVYDHHRGVSAAEVPAENLRLVAPAPVTEDASAEELLAQCVRPFLDRLEEPYRSALRMTELEGMTQAEAADAEGISVSGMKSRVQRGRAYLRGELEACCHIELDARNRVHDAEARAGCGCRVPDQF